jgi:anaerobic selenocysteine-containing dehydrogenase
VVHELFVTDTANYADIVLPATSQLEQVDLHKGYGHTVLSYNQQAIPPLGESKSNWEVMRLLAKAMGFAEPWLRQDVDEVIDEILTATAMHNPGLSNINLAQLKSKGSIPLKLESTTPFANLHFPTPSGKLELYSHTMAEAGLDPLPGWVAGEDDASPPNGQKSASRPLNLLTGASHHFVSSSLANQAGLLEKEKTPFVEIHPADAADHDIAHGDIVIIENSRGWCKLRAVITDAVRPGVLVSPKVRWAKLDPFRNGNQGRNVNWTTSDALGDMAGQSTFHSNKVWLRKAV